MNDPDVRLGTAAARRDAADQDLWIGSPSQVARRLLGKLLVRVVDGQRLSGIIVEVEAYLSGNDAASHSARGPTPGNRSMFLPAGHWYVYPIHSRHCVNVVTQPHGVGSAVLIRALQSWEGLDAMQENRQLTPRENRTYITASQRTCRELTSGPGRLCQALGIDRRYDGLKICADTGLWIETLSPSALSPRRWKIRSSPRIGIRRSVDLPLRWFIDGNIFVSGLARQHTDGRKWLFSHS